jgi:hypothetical protein
MNWSDADTSPVTYSRAAYLLLAWGCLVLMAGFWLFFAVPVAADDPVIITNWGDMPAYPTQAPYPTQIPYPTVCATSAAGNVCGMASVNVAHTNGEGGYQLAILAALVLGFGFLSVLQVASFFFVSRRSPQ